ncbi:MAG: ribonuclease P protein component [Cyanobacteria bacterium]|uniref:ribonuclease P protein component n=1 Tax=Geminocystis sp. TaxID=2664100 RepID=UPI001DB8A4A3|nr:ribonuclease P protein component [Cyanobacteria bacterium CG_2015-16_32_12]NCO77814.1 ribonuclease P protein component [Cyanobacteria bacterium CG_2015-22_32_23]NCQ05021.1 ribonuclease P protein component [Cyanobacteria bacterium CG_2015-09_32_10]NCQ43111.1 ribonuclease P protein component [Cyanobacteria bacterium CG_2015-04_32_10]NCS86199.1 ribonuclease P protein component [Cyanobacteria bacterium CG_2015-02_32_10]
MGLPSRHRLKRRWDFQSVYQQGIRRSSRHLIIRALPVAENSVNQLIDTKIGISISRKVSKKAVVRNRIKRQIRSIFRCLLPKISSGWLIIVIVKPEAQECNYEHFLRELEQLLIRAEIIHGH